MDVLNSWADVPDMEDVTFLEYTRQWINVQSRGGLFKVSDDVYRFFRLMEFVTKAEVNTNNIGTLKKTNIHALLLTALRNDKYVMKTWDKIRSKLSTELGNLLLTKSHDMLC
ncbi:hypothetical protein HOLleu_03517 [Holothuria leucospilota]|uniref:Uncharacterized protein n=1 Tax=Holothuria leucospilota TaxID=206669 RepID=A0A9Q1CSN6_HOLLE|nr:hypothetical protein HOLleu_03517 [Holothuria leucospilota]